MYRFHVWVVLAESTQESDVGHLAEKIGGLRERVAQLPMFEGLEEFPSIWLTG